MTTWDPPSSPRLTAPGIPPASGVAQPAAAPLPPAPVAERPRGTANARHVVATVLGVGAVGAVVALASRAGGLPGNHDAGRATTSELVPRVVLGAIVGCAVGVGLSFLFHLRAAPRTRRLYEIDIVLILSFACVIAVHTTSHTVATDDYVLNGLLALVHFTRQVFFALTAFVLLYGQLNKPVSMRTFWPKRFLLVGVPYVVWSTIYFVSRTSSLRRSSPDRNPANRSEILGMLPALPGSAH